MCCLFFPRAVPSLNAGKQNGFTHGAVQNSKWNGEVVVRVKDEKGEWEGFTEEKNAPAMSEGLMVCVRIISAQPDGRNVLACGLDTTTKNNNFAHERQETWKITNNI